MSRLDRLFTLLSTSTSASARNLAAQQLGEVQQAHPEELHNLLTRLHPLLKSKRWETRIGAASAITAILKEMPEFRPEAIKTEEDDKAVVDVKMAFDLSRIVGEHEAELGASQGSEFDQPTEGSSNSEVQIKRVNAELGLDTAAKLGIIDEGEELVTKDDLKVLPNNENLSARERNLKRRQLRKKDREQEAQKKRKLEGNFYNVTDEQKDDLGTKVWPLKAFCETLKKDLKSTAWEDRHGAASALRHVIDLHGATAGYATGLTSVQAQRAHFRWLHDMAYDLLTVLARDRFGDFLSDQVVAPVRETTSMALGNLLKLMPTEMVEAVVVILLQLTDQSDWQCRHGGYLGLKYLLAGCTGKLSLDLVVRTIYSNLYRGLQDVVDDVVSVAAEALVPVVQKFINHIDVDTLSDALWNCLTDLDDLAGSTQATMKLLSEIVVIKVPEKCGPRMKELAPRLFPFFHHPSSGVRRASLQTLHALVSQKRLALEFLPFTCGPIMSHLFQRSLVESDPVNLNLIERAWSKACDNCPLGALLTATCPLYGSWFVLISKPPIWPLPNELLIITKKDDFQYLGGPPAQHSTDELERNILAARSRCSGARLLGKLAGFILQPVPGFDYSKDPMTPVELFVQKILLANLTKSGYQSTAIALVIQGWRSHHTEQVSSIAPQSLKLAIHEYLVGPLEFEETSQTWGQLQTDASDLLATLKYHKIMVLENTELVPDKPSASDIEQLTNYPLDASFKKSKLKPLRMTTLLSRQADIKQRFVRVDSDIQTLTTMTLGALAGALVQLGFLPDKMNPVIKPLMESIKKEPIAELQKLCAKNLVVLIDLCLKKQLSNPAEKVTKNLIHFAFADRFADLEPFADDAIIALEQNKMSKAPGVSPQTRGSVEALREIVKHFKTSVTNQPPKFFDKVVIPFQQDHLWMSLDPSAELMPYLFAFKSVADKFDESLHHELLKTCDSLAKVLSHSKAGVRHLAAEVFASLASFLTIPTMSAVMKSVITKLESPQANQRRGAIEAMYCIVKKLEVGFVPFIVLIVVPILGRMSDQVIINF